MKMKPDTGLPTGTKTGMFRDSDRLIIKDSQLNIDNCFQHMKPDNGSQLELVNWNASQL